MIDTLVTKSMLENDISYINKLPTIALSETENELIMWLQDYHHDHDCLPTKERFEKTDYAHYWNAHLTSSPFSDIMKLTLDHLKKLWFADEFRKLQTRLETDEDVSFSDINAISKQLGQFNNTVVNDIFSVDRIDLYSHELPENVLMFNWIDIDISTGGIFPGELCLLVARPGTGKSLISFYLATQWAREGKRVLVISSEMAIQQMVSRFDAMLANFNPIIHRTKDDFTLLDQYSKEIDNELATLKSKGGNIIFPHQGTITTNMINGMLTEHNPDVLIVDGVYCVNNSSKLVTNEWQKEAAVITEIKQMGLDYNIPVFTTTQTNRQGGNSHFGLDNIAGSDYYSKVADIVIGAWPFADEISSDIELQPLKNRNGKKQGLTTLSIDWNTCTITEKILLPKT